MSSFSDTGWCCLYCVPVLVLWFAPLILVGVCSIYGGAGKLCALLLPKRRDRVA